MKSTLHWVMPEAKVKHLERGGPYGLMLELADPVTNQRLEKDQGPLGRDSTRMPEKSH
jgi:hypothetical protein